LMVAVGQLTRTAEGVAVGWMTNEQMQVTVTSDWQCTAAVESLESKAWMQAKGHETLTATAARCWSGERLSAETRYCPSDRASQRRRYHYRCSESYHRGVAETVLR
jgi:hypothetical protein